MVVHDADEALMLLLQFHPVLNGPEVIADMELAGGLNPRENPRHGLNAMRWLEGPQGG
jgi:hypothetical protein